MDSNLKIAVVLSAVDKMSSVIRNATSGAAKNLNSFSSKANNVANKAFDVGRSAGAIGLAIGTPLFMAAQAAEESEIATKRLENIFKSMGETTGKAAKAAEAYASSLQMQIGVDDESILLTQAKLATFAKVSDETARMSGIFDRATNAAYDMAAAGFGEAEQNAVQLGKALQDPIKGITALAKSGVTFTAQEKAKIKTLVDSGKQLEAQKIILKAIEMQVGGTAKATATTSSKMKASFGELQESLGRALLPTLNKLMQKVIPIINKVMDWIEKNPELTETIMMIAAGAAALAITVSGLSFIIGGVAKAVSGLSAAFSFLAANPIILIIAAIAAAAYLVVKYWANIKQFFINLWTKIKEVFWKVVAWMKEWGPLFLGPIGIIYKFFTDAKFREAGKKLVVSIWEGIKSMAYKPIEAIKNMVSKIREYLPFSPAKVGALRDIHKIKLVETIAQSIKPAPMVKAMRMATAATMVAATPMKSNAISQSSGGQGSGMVVNYNPTINVNGGSPTSKEDFKKVLKEHEKDIIKLIEEANRKSNRTKL